MLATKQYMFDNGQVGLNAMAISQHKMHHDFIQKRLRLASCVTMLVYCGVDDIQWAYLNG